MRLRNLLTVASKNKLRIVFSIIAIYVIKVCILSSYISEIILSKTLPLSFLLIALAIMDISIRRNS